MTSLQTHLRNASRSKIVQISLLTLFSIGAGYMKGREDAPVAQERNYESGKQSGRFLYQPQSAMIMDVNNDGILDVVTHTELTRTLPKRRVLELLHEGRLSDERTPRVFLGTTCLEEKASAPCVPAETQLVSEYHNNAYTSDLARAIIGPNYKKQGEKQ